MPDDAKKYEAKLAALTRKSFDSIRQIYETSVLELALKMADDAEVRAQLEAALTSRSVIDQALGIIMGQNRCSSEEAFRLLRDASQNRNVKLRELAAAMVASVAKGQAPRNAIW